MIAEGDLIAWKVDGVRLFSGNWFGKIIVDLEDKYYGSKEYAAYCNYGIDTIPASGILLHLKNRNKKLARRRRKTVTL